MLILLTNFFSCIWSGTGALCGQSFWGQIKDKKGRP